jgi:hypothetical protein
MTSYTTAVQAIFKMSWGWAVQSEGSPAAAGSLLPILSTGTNSGAPPTGWAATIALDVSSYNALVNITGDASLTVNAMIQADYRYVQ